MSTPDRAKADYLPEASSLNEGSAHPACSACVPVDLDALREADLAAERALRDGEYERIALALGEELRLSRDAGACWAFFRDAYWDDYAGRGPNLNRHGPEDALRFVIARAFGGGTRARNTRAGEIAQACSSLRHSGTSPEDVVAELKRAEGPSGKSGVKMLAALEAERTKAGSL
jgi:hypothetical protein